jgi:hypothetical protein
VRDAAGPRVAVADGTDATLKSFGLDVALSEIYRRVF